MAGKSNQLPVEAGEAVCEGMPRSFSLCVQTECPMGTHCLRRKAWSMIPDAQLHVSVINPARTRLSGQCPQYRSDVPVRYARGFKGMQAQMLPAQYEQFSSKLMARFSRNGYYLRRRGERLCSPKEIIDIRHILQSMGLERLEFDAYEMRCDWED